MKFHYKAADREGKLVQGFVEAKDTRQAVEYLRSKELVTVKISKKEKNKFLKAIPIFSGRVTLIDTSVFTRQLASMLSAGLTLLQSLETIKTQTNKRVMVEVIESIISDIEEGKSFSSAISDYPEIFSSVYVSVIKTSESSGILDKALLRFAENLEKEQKLKSTIKAALAYPVIIVFGMVIVVIIMMVFVIPALSDVYESIPNFELPLPTKIVITLSNFTVNFWPFIGPLVILLWFSYRFWRKTEAARYITDNLLLRLPIFGPLVKKTILTEFSRSMGLLVGTGVLLVDALTQTSETTGNIHYKNAIMGVSERVQRGEAMGEALSHYKLFPPILVNLVGVGEQTGKIDELLLKASEYFEEEVNRAVKTLVTALEPIIMVVLGVGVAFLVLSILTPMYNLVSSL